MLEICVMLEVLKRNKPKKKKKKKKEKKNSYKFEGDGAISFGPRHWSDLIIGQI